MKRIKDVVGLFDVWVWSSTSHVEGLLTGWTDACGVGGSHPQLILSVGHQIAHGAVRLLHFYLAHWKSSAHRLQMSPNESTGGQSDLCTTLTVAVRAVRAVPYQVARRCRLPACPPAGVCSRARSTPQCRQRTGSSTHAGTPGWLSWRSGDWSPGQMELLQRAQVWICRHIKYHYRTLSSMLPVQSSIMMLVINTMTLWPLPSLITPAVK